MSAATSRSLRSDAQSSILDIKTARVFAPLLDTSRYKGAFGGRGSGKSHFFAERAVELCVARPRTRIVCVREVQKSLKESVKLLIEDKIGVFGLGRAFDMRADHIVTPGNGLILFQGMREHTKESIKSLEDFDVAYVEEGQTLSPGSLEMLRPTLRSDTSELWFSWNPRSAKDPVDALLRGQSPPARSAVVRANYKDNPFFPKVLEEERQHDREHRAGRYAHIWLGEYEPMAVGAIWDRATLHEQRRKEAPDMRRVVVGVDPAVTDTETSDEHGIIVAGVGDDSRGYVLDDTSTSGSPHKWATRVVATFDLHEADAVVIEVNQGGDMVANTLRSVRPNLPIIEVRASRGKHVRAEPVAALYGLGRVSHVGTFPELEDQMCLMTAAGYEGEDSPDRCDALVWAMSELFPQMTRRAGKKPSVAGPVLEGGWMA